MTICSVSWSGKRRAAWGLLAFCFCAPDSLGAGKHGTPLFQDEPSCKTLWENRRKALDARTLSLPSARACPSTRAMVLAYMITNGRAEDCSLHDLEHFADLFPVWPQRDHLMTIIEGQMLRRTHDTKILAGWFRKYPPSTFRGLVWTAAHLRSQKREQETLRLVRTFWRDHTFSADQHKTFLALYGKDLRIPDHRRRIVHQLLDGRVDQARMTSGALRKTLPAVTRLCVERWARPVQSPEKLTSGCRPGSAEALSLALRALDTWRLTRKKASCPPAEYKALAEKACKKLQEHASGALTDDPLVLKKVAAAREDTVRALVFAGLHRKALELASQHGLAEGCTFVESERQCGRLALRHLNQPKQAVAHLKRALGRVSRLDRWVEIQFWLGCAFEKTGQKENARAAWEACARFPHFFYGQQARVRLQKSPSKKTKTLPVVPAQLKGQKVLPLQAQKAAASVVCQAARLDAALFQGMLAALLRAEVRLAPSVLEAMTSRIRAEGKPRHAVDAAKHLWLSHPDLTVSEAFYPLWPVENNPGPGISPDLWHAVIHRESSFDPDIRGDAGEYGLMQIMPGTADTMARRMGIRYQKPELCSRPELNIRLGCGYLEQMREAFPTSLPCVVGAYNAGRTRVNQWVRFMGQPGEPLDVLDWIESVPVASTCAYIKAVLANLGIYYHKRTGNFPSSLFSPDLSQAQVSPSDVDAS
jgi:soluble lytic murein transglycosylase